LADRVTVVALAHSGGYLLAAGLLWWRLDHVLAQPLGIGRLVAGLVAAAALAGVAMWAVTVALDVEGRVAALLVGALAAAVGLLVDAAAARAAGIRLPGALRLEPAHG
jgi:hypothetical protein